MANEKELTVMTVTGHGKTVEIYFNKEEMDYDKQLIIVDKPISTGSGGVHNDADTLLIDLGRLKQIVSLTNAWLIDEASSSAYQKKIDMEYIFKRKGNINFMWKEYDGATLREIPKVGNIIKCKITAVPGRVGDSAQIFSGTQTKMFMINIQFAVGTHKG